MLCQFLSILAEQINYFFVGNLNDTVALAAVGIGNMTINVIAIATIMGMNTALETRVAQAFGAGNLRKCGVFLNRGRIVIISMLLPLFGILYFTEEILVMLRQNEEVAKLASNYIITLSPGIFAYALFDANRCFLNALNYTVVPTMVQLLGVPLHFFWAQYFVKQYGMIGVCYAHNITYFTLFAAISLYTWRIEEIR